MNEDLNTGFSREYFEKRLKSSTESFNYANRLLDTFIFTICGGGVYYAAMLKQWALDSGKIDGNVNVMVSLITGLFLLVIILNIWGQEMSSSSLKYDMEWCRESLKKWTDPSLFNQEEVDRYDRLSDKYSKFITPINRTFYVLFVIAVVLSFILFVIIS